MCVVVPVLVWMVLTVAVAKGWSVRGAVVRLEAVVGDGPAVVAGVLAVAVAMVLLVVM